MSTKIEWTDETWNPVTGCTKVSQGCKNCYAERIWPKVEAAERMREHWDWRQMPKRAFTDVRTHPNRLDAPLHWKKPRRIFVNSMSDLFHEDVPDAFIEQVYAVMARAPQHTFQILTKRAQRMLNWYMGRALVNTGDDLFAAAKGRWPLPNVWMGVSVEDQETAKERIPLLLKIPAAVRFLSCEPLLGRIDLCETFGMWWNSTMQCFEADGQCFNAKGTQGQAAPGIGWVIAGGESGPKARPSHPDWFRSLRNQCAAARVPFFFKQWGEWGQRHELANDSTMIKLGKKAAGRLLDGVEHMEYPA